MRYQIDNSEDINKVYQAPYPSGASILPFNYGWSNKYGPKPFGLRVRPTTYSGFAKSGMNYPPERPFNPNFVPAYYYQGPINSIYEVDISGVGTLSGGCVDGESINGRYYLYQVSDMQNQTLNNLYAVGRKTNQVYWFGKMCNKDKPINLCNLDTMILSLETQEDGIATPNSSGNLRLTLLLPYNKSIVPSTQASGYIRFSKQFGYIETFSSLSVGRYGSEAYKDKFPYMVEGEHILSPDSDNNYGNYSSHLSNSTLVSSTYPQDATFGDFSVDLTSAYVTVRPYKANFYDVKNVNINFASGIHFPIYTNYALVALNNAGQNGTLRDAYTGAFTAYTFPQNYYLTNNSNYNKLIGNQSQVSGEYMFHPYHLSLRINNVKTANSGIIGCESCEEYFHKPKQMAVVGQGTNSDARYIWSGFSFIESDQIGNVRYDHNYYNICDMGCGSSPFVSAVGDRNSQFKNGACNNFLELEIEEPGTINVGVVASGSAYLYFAGIYSSGVTTRIGYSKKRLRKELCYQSSSNPCYNSGARSLSNPNGIKDVVLGLHNVFNSGFWSGSWTLEDTPTNNRPRISSEVDIMNHCDFQNVEVILTPPNIPSTPCATPACTICDGTNVPVTANFHLEMAFYSGTSPSSYTLMSGITKNYIMTLINNNSNGNSSRYGGRNCYWQYLSPTTQVSKLEYYRLSGGYNVFQLISPDIVTTYTGSITSDVAISGISTGKAVDYRIDCSAGLSRTDTIETRLNTPPSMSGVWQKTVYSASITFTDLYDIRDYL